MALKLIAGRINFDINIQEVFCDLIGVYDGHNWLDIMGKGFTIMY